MLPTRAAAVAAAVPPLRSILIRALSTSAPAAEYAQSPRPRSSSPRPATAGPSRSSRPGRPAPSHDPSMPRFAAGPPSRSGGRFGSSNRLAPLERSRDESSSYSVENIGQIGEEEEMDSESGGALDREERGEFVYHHKPRKFKPNTYPVPESSGSREAAQPARFEKFELNPALVGSMQERHGEAAHTTQIQSLSLSHLCDPEAEAKGRRVILGAETGSGKTLAYLLPLMHHLKATEAAAQPNSPAEEKQLQKMLYPRAIVLSPTHELNRQSTATAKSLTHGIKLRVAGLSNTKDGGIGSTRGLVDCLFSTGAMLRRMFGIRKPGMDLDEGYAKTEWVSADKVEWLVIDEADVMLSRDFRQETLLMLKHIASRSPNLNIVLTTATFPPDLLNLLKSHEDLIATPFTHLLSPALHKLPRNLEARFIPRSKGDLISDVCHEVRRVLAEDALKRMQMGLGGKVTDRSKVIVFCNSDSKVKRVSAELTMRDLPNLTWTKEGEERKVGSTGRLKAFLTDPKATADKADGQADKDKDKSQTQEGVPTPRILVTTGILSRGLDFSPTVSTVFLVDQPKDILDFIHRAGRAGRAGRKGRVVIFGSAQGRSAQNGKLGSMIRDASKDGRRTQEEQARYDALERERKKKIGKESGWWGREAEETKRTKARRREAEEAAAARAARRPIPREESAGVEERKPWWVTTREIGKGKPKRG